MNPKPRYAAAAGLRLLSALALAAAVCIGAAATPDPAAAQSQAASAAPAASRPLARLSFIAGAPEASAAAADQALRGILRKGRCGYLYMAECADTPQLLEKTAIGSFFWLPWVHAELESRLPKGSVVLDPLLLVQDASGQVVARSAIDAAAAPLHVLVLPFRHPYYDSFYGYPKNPSSQGEWVALIVVPLAATPGQRDFPWQAVVDQINGEWGKKAKVSRARGWTGFVAADPRRTSDRGKPVVEAANAILAMVKTAEAKSPAAEQVARYEALLEPNDRTPEPELFAYFLAAETRYLQARSDLLVKELTAGRTGLAAREVLKAEQTAINQQTAAGFAGALAMMGTMGAAGASFTHLGITMDTFSKQREIAGIQQTAMAGVVGEQVTVAVGDGGAVTVTAGSVDELRGKFRALSASAAAQ